MCSSETAREEFPICHSLPGTPNMSADRVLSMTMHQGRDILYQELNGHKHSFVNLVFVENNVIIRV